MNEWILAEKETRLDVFQKFQEYKCSLSVAFNLADNSEFAAARKAKRYQELEKKSPKKETRKRVSPSASPDIDRRQARKERKKQKKAEQPDRRVVPRKLKGMPLKAIRYTVDGLGVTAYD